MVTDMVVALGPATVNRQTLFAFHHTSGADRRPLLRRCPGRLHAPGETVAFDMWRLPQARQTLTVLGCGTSNAWGYACGVNERNVAIGTSAWQGKLRGVPTGLSGMDLVRLGLERGHSAQNAVDILTELIGRHGLTAGPMARTSGAVFLIADGRVAVSLEATGHHWAITSACQTRAASDLALIRQDWERLSPGLSELALQGGWWTEGGCKLDFAGSLAVANSEHAKTLKRWGRATLLLEQQNGAMDHEVLRRLLAEHHEALVAPTSSPVSGVTTFLTELTTDSAMGPIAWYADGPPRQAAYFPVLLDGELPESILVGDPSALRQSPAEVETLQERWDDAVERFMASVNARNVDRATLQRQATLLMHRLAAGLSGHEDEPIRYPRHATSSERVAEFAYVSE